MKKQRQQSILGFFQQSPSIPQVSSPEVFHHTAVISGIAKILKENEERARSHFQMEEEVTKPFTDNDTSNTQMEIEVEKENHQQIQNNEDQFIKQPEESSVEIQKSEVHKTQKQDQRKFFSGRKPKALEKTIQDYLENIHYKGWLKIEKRVGNLGESQLYFLCCWCRQENETNQLSQGLLFATDARVCSSFSSTRLYEHGQSNKQHKAAKTTYFHQKFNFNQQPRLTPSNLATS